MVHTSKAVEIQAQLRVDSFDVGKVGTVEEGLESGIVGARMVCNLGTVLVVRSGTWRR